MSSFKSNLLGSATANTLATSHLPAAVMPDFLSNLNQDALVLWGGGLRWVYHDDAQAVADYSRQVGGWYWAVGETMPVILRSGRSWPVGQRLRS